MNLHPYDNVERRFHHGDADPRDGLAVVKQVLRLAEPPPAGVLYDLSFYSGGMGIIDHLAITLPADSKLWAEVITAFEAKTPEEAGADPEWGESLLWLLCRDEEETLLRPAAVRFVNENRQPFQAECHPANRIFFESWSGVNHWSALWGDEARLNYIGFDQG